MVWLGPAFFSSSLHSPSENEVNAFLLILPSEKKFVADLPSFLKWPGSAWMLFHAPPISPSLRDKAVTRIYSKLLRQVTSYLYFFEIAIWNIYECNFFSKILLFLGLSHPFIPVYTSEVPAPRNLKEYDIFLDENKLYGTSYTHPRGF